MMKDEKFSEYTERCLSLGRIGGWEKEIKAKEAIAWELHAEFPPAGGLLLSHLILGQGRSYIHPNIGTKEYAKKLAAESFQAVQELEQKDGWDHYYLGSSYQHGLGTHHDWKLAAASYDAAAQEGNPYAKFEFIWALHLAGGSRLEAILALTDLRGKMADFAAYSARALSLLELGPAREVASSCHIARILLLKRALHNFIYHDHGARQLRVAIEKELREEVVDLQRLNTTRSHFALYLIASTSRSNPTGAKPIEWFQRAIDPSIEELLILCRRYELKEDELRRIVERAEAEDWLDTPLAKLAASQLESDDS
jgi:hypothetical protein